MAERRKFYRLGAKFSLTYHKESSSSPVEKGTIAKDISPGGVRFLSNDAVPVGTHLAMTLVFPDLTEPVHFEVKVVWTEPLPPSPDGTPSNGFENGAEFVNISPEKRQLIDQHITLFKGA